jgi:hypothetical protein
MKKLAIVLIVCLLTSLSTPSTAVGTFPADSQAELRWTTSPNYDAESDPSKLWWAVSFLGDLTPETNPWFVVSKSGRLDKFCDGLDVDCLSDMHESGLGRGLFQMCSISKVAPCVETLEFQKPDGAWSLAQVEREVDLTPTAQKISDFAAAPYLNKVKLDIQSQWGWDSNPELGLPASASGPIIFKFPGRSNSAGEETYALQATFDISGLLASGKSAFAEDDFNISLRPIKAVACANNNPAISVILGEPNDGIPWRGFSAGACYNQSAYVASDEIGWPARYNEKFPIRLTVQLPRNLGGWFQGRVEDPSISVTAIDAKTNRVTFVGAPATVPITAKQILVDDPSSEEIIKAMGNSVEGLKGFQARGGTGPTGPVWTPRLGTSWFDLWSSRLGDTARGSASLWSFAHFKSDQRCMGDRSQLQGLVTTNAMLYQADTPKLKDGFLTYKVAGQHLDSDGKVFKGTYNFIMRSSVARCLYGFTSAPISGTVSVSSAEGEKQVAVTSVTEKEGWLKLSASGFSFSTPTISMKLTQTKTLQKKTTITCLSKKNAKLTKRVTALAPKCPAGYKQK